MVKSGVMDAAFTGKTEADSNVGTPSWILLTPSAESDLWRQAIVDAAMGADRIVADPNSDNPALRSDPKVIFLTDDPSNLDGVETGGVIIPQPHTAPNAIADLHSCTVSSNIEDASLRLAGALALSRSLPTITANDLQNAPRTVNVVGLEITPPTITTSLPVDGPVSTAFDIYRRIPSDRSKATLWSEELFTYEPRATQGHAVPGDIDITGPPKLLIYGPCIALPPGTWRTTIRFGVDKDAAMHEFRFDWGTRTACLSENVRPQAPGFYELSLEWVWEQTDVAEIRVIVTEGAFTGHLMFRGATVEPVL